MSIWCSDIQILYSHILALYWLFLLQSTEHHTTSLRVEACILSCYDTVSALAFRWEPMILVFVFWLHKYSEINWFVMRSRCRLIPMYIELHSSSKKLIKLMGGGGQPLILQHLVLTWTIVICRICGTSPLSLIWSKSFQQNIALRVLLLTLLLVFLLKSYI